MRGTRSWGGREGAPFQHDATVSLKVTPITDLRDEQPAHLFTFPAPARPERRVLEVPLLLMCTTIRLRIEVTGRAGPVEVYTPIVPFQAVAGASTVTFAGTA